VSMSALSLVGCLFLACISASFVQLTLVDSFQPVLASPSLNERLMLTDYCCYFQFFFYWPILIYARSGTSKVIFFEAGLT